jgi:heptosyltransferase-2
MNIANKRNPINKILIFSPNWIGDTVISTALVSLIKKEFPASAIVIAANKYVYPLWEANPLVKEIWRCELRGVSYIISYIKFFFKLKKNRFDLAIILPHCFRYALFAFFAGIPLRAAYNIGPRKIFLTHHLDYNVSLRDEHMLDNYLAILSLLGIKSGCREPVLRVAAENEIKANNFFKINQIAKDEVIIGIGPGAIYGKAKRWPKEKYVEIIGLLSSEYRPRIFVFTGPKEKILADWFKENVHNPSVIFIDHYSLSEVMSLIKKCGLFIGNDSGLAHIASAMDIRTISLFGSTSPQWTAPCGEKNITLKKHVSCGPCFAKTCSLGHYLCLNSISLEDVMCAVNIQLKKISERKYNIYQ